MLLLLIYYIFYPVTLFQLALTADFGWPTKIKHMSQGQRSLNNLTPNYFMKIFDGKIIYTEYKVIMINLKMTILVNFGTSIGKNPTRKPIPASVLTTLKVVFTLDVACGMHEIDVRFTCTKGRG